MQRGNEGWNWVLWATLTILTLVYFPAFTNDYAKLDTFVLFSNIYFDYFEPWTSWVAIQGRPLTSLATYAAFSSIESIFDLQWIRFIGFAGTLFLAFSVNQSFKQQGCEPASRLLLTLVLSCTPGVATLTLWTVCFPYTWAAGIAIWGGQMLSQSRSDGKNTRFASYQELSGATLIFLSLWVYQPSALFCLIPIGYRFLTTSEQNGAFLKSSFPKVFWVCLPLGVYYILFKTVYLNWMPDQEGYFRDRLSPPESLWAHMFSTTGKSLMQTLEGWAFFYGPTVTWISVGLASLSLLYGFFKVLGQFQVSKTVMRCFPMGALVALSLIPAFYLSSEDPLFRMMGPFEGLFILLLWSSFRNFPLRSMRTTAFACFALLYILGAAFVIRDAWVQPASKELAAFDAFFAERVHPETPALITYKAERWVYGSKRRRHIFGFLSSNQPWVMPHISRLLVSEHYGKTFAEELPIFASQVRVRAPFALVVDANEILFAESAYETPYISDKNDLFELKMSRRSWWLSSWLGIYEIIEINDDKTGRLNHLMLGEIEYRWEGDDLLIYREGNGWLRTNAELFPLAQASDGASLVELIPTKLQNTP